MSGEIVKGFESCPEGCGLSHRIGHPNPIHDGVWLEAERKRLTGEVADWKAQHDRAESHAKIAERLAHGLQDKLADAERRLREVEAERDKYLAAANTATCVNEPCPACGGHGPSGEWSEGSEVRCDDCGAMLYVTNVETCMGRSSFEKIPAPCKNEMHDDDCELECADPDARALPGDGQGEG